MTEPARVKTVRSLVIERGIAKRWGRAGWQVWQSKAGDQALAGMLELFQPPRFLISGHTSESRYPKEGFMHIHRQKKRKKRTRADVKHGKCTRIGDVYHTC